MKPAAFDYQRIQSVEQACQALARAGEDARILAGGQSLVTVLNMRLSQPALVLDISRCEELRFLQVEKNQLRIGAAVTQAQLHAWPTLAQDAPLLAQALPFISHFQIRNRGTVAGSIAHADPSAELPLCLAALGGEVVLQSAKGRRVLAAADFQQGMLTTARRPDELVTEERFPLARPGHAYVFDEFSLRRGDFAIVACAVDLHDAGLRLGIGGVADRPVVADWPRLDEPALRERINDLAWSLQAQDDQHASAVYRRHLVRHMAWNAIQRAGQALDSQRKPS
ncbi:FAD binding domain-containing protein [Alcaligenes sp. Marseille-Q7550]